MLKNRMVHTAQLSSNPSSITLWFILLNLTLVANVFYIQFLWHLHSQFTTIYYNNMETSTGWSTANYPSAVVCGDNRDIDKCVSETCCRIRADGSLIPEGYIYRSFDTSSYGSLQLQFDITSYGVRTDDACTV
eukprot:452688_1